ncbi:hypothetical protein V6W80_11780 [Pseudomonas benzopyrenica]|uniref:Uncharacterized protein n=1 Tax=Pseudomonas benzopyrenica TaxID=2993566 RepID=A0ABZ2FVP4_9PSED
MTTSPVPAITDDQVAEAEARHTLLLRAKQSLPEALGLPPETRLIDSPIRSPMMRRPGRRWSVEVAS